MSMLEKMAEAAWVAVEFGERPADDLITEWKEAGSWWPNVGQYIGAEGFRRAARAALLAVREPSEAALLVGDEAFICGAGTLDHTYDLKLVWPAMIDAILSGEQPSNESPTRQSDAGLTASENSNNTNSI